MFGLAARNAGLSPIEASAFSLIVFAGAAQFAAVGYLAAGMPWLPIVVLTFLLNIRHLLYSASLAPQFRQRAVASGAPRWPTSSPTRRSRSSSAHFPRIGRVDVGGYWIAALVGDFIPWNLATIAGVLLGRGDPGPGDCSGSTSSSRRRWRGWPPGS